MHKPLQNTLKEDPRRKDCVEFNNPNIWLHSSLECPENRSAGDKATGIAIIAALVIVMLCLGYAASIYPKAYPNNVTVNK